MADDEKLKQQCADRKQERAEIKRRKRGRPTKAELKAKSKGGRGKVGRPKGDAAIINDYKARMLASPKSKAVLETLFDVASDPDHKHWAAATKLVMDRLAPNSYYEKDKLSGGRNAIQINISGVGEAAVSAEAPTEVQEAEYTEVSDGD